MKLSVGASVLAITFILAGTLTPVNNVRADFWPSTWAPYLKSSNHVEDPGLDSTPGGTDLVGNATLGYPAAYYASDGTNLFFRLRVRSFPGSSGAFSNYAWVVLFDTNNNVTHYEWALYLDGITERVQLRHNTIQTGGFSDVAEVGYDIGSTLSYARSGAAGSNLHGYINYFIDWYIPWSTFTNKTGLASTSTVRMFFAAAYSSADYSKDKMGGDPTTLPDAWGDSTTFAASALNTLTILVGDGEPSANHQVNIDGTTYLTNSSGYASTKLATGTHTVEILTKNITSTSAYAFQQWADGDTNNPRTISISSNTVLSAIIKLQYLLTVTSPYGSPTGAGWYDVGANATFSVTSPIQDAPGRRRTATGFTLDSTPHTGNTGSVIMNSPHTVAFNWKTQYLLSLSTQPANLDNPTGTGWYDTGTTATISTDELANTTATTRYRFTQWTGDISSTSRTTSVLINAAKNATAMYNIEWKVTAQTSGCALPISISIDSQTYTSPVSMFFANSTTHTFSTPTSVTNSSDWTHKCTFQSWGGLKNSTSTTIQLTATTSGNLTANYQTQYRLEALTDPFGLTPQPNGTGWYSESTTLNLTAPTVTGYTFNAWYLDGVNAGGGTLTVHMNMSHTAIASYAGPGYKITISSSGLTTPTPATHIFIDGRDIGRPYLYDGQNRTIWFIPSTTHSVQAYQYIYEGTNTRRHTPDYLVPVTATSTVTFPYHTEILVTIGTQGLTSSQVKATILIGEANVAGTDRTRKPLSLYDGNPTTIWVHRNTLIWVSSLPVPVSTESRFIVNSTSPTQATTPGTYNFQFQPQHRLTITVYPYYLYLRISGTGWYDQNLQVSITAPPKTGWKISQWVIDGVPQPATSYTLTLTMGQPHAVTAKYLPDRSSTSQNILQTIIDWIFGRLYPAQIQETNTETGDPVEPAPITPIHMLAAATAISVAIIIRKRKPNRED